RPERSADDTVDCRPGAAVPRGDSGPGSACEGAGVCAPHGMVSDATAGSLLSGVALERTGGRRAAAAFAAARPPHESGIASDAGPRRAPRQLRSPRGFALSQDAPIYVLRGRSRAQPGLRAFRIQVSLIRR